MLQIIYDTFGMHMGMLKKPGLVFINNTFSKCMCWRALFYCPKKSLGTKKSPQTTLSIKLVLVSKQIRKLYRISCYINSLYV